MIVGHSQGAMQAVKILHKLAGHSADRIAVCLGLCADGTILDLYTWTAAPGAAYQGHAVVIDPVARATCPAASPFGTVSQATEGALVYDPIGGKVYVGLSGSATTFLATVSYSSSAGYGTSTPLPSPR